MKKLCVLFLSVLLLFTLVACNQTAPPPETTAEQTTTPPSTEAEKETDAMTEAACTHDFNEATCTLPKICKLCKAIQGQRVQQYHFRTPGPQIR